MELVHWPILWEQIETRVIPPQSDLRITEDGENRITEDGENRITEGT